MVDSTFDSELYEQVVRHGGSLQSSAAPTAIQPVPRVELYEPVGCTEAAVLHTRPDGVRLVVDTIDCWPNGFTAWVKLEGESWQSEEERRLFPSRAEKIMLGGGPSSLRFGIVYSDGRWVDEVNLAQRSMYYGVLATGINGYFGGNDMIEQIYVTPAPPAGPIVIVVEWPGRDIPLRTSSIDGDVISFACERAAAKPRKGR